MERGNAEADRQLSGLMCCKAKHDLAVVGPQLKKKYFHSCVEKINNCIVGQIGLSKSVPNHYLTECRENL